MARFLKRVPMRVGSAITLFLLSGLPIHAQQVDVWSRPVQTERTRSVDFIHYRVNLTFDLDAKVFWGENLITFSPFSDGVDHIELDAEEIIIEARNSRGQKTGAA